MTFTYDPATDLGFVRLLIPDTIQENATFSDEEITVFLTREGGDVWGAASTACLVLANSETLVGKVVSILGVSTNGAAVGAALRAQAGEYRRRVGTAALIGDAGFVGGEYMAIASGVSDTFSAGESLIEE